MTRSYWHSNLSVLAREYKMYKQNAVSFNLPNGKNIPNEYQTASEIKNIHPVKDQNLIEPPSPPKKQKKKRKPDSVHEVENQRTKSSNRFTIHNKKIKSINMNGKTKQVEHSYEVIFNDFPNVPKKGKKLDEANKSKNKQEKKHFKKFPIHIKRQSSSFYVDEIDEEKNKTYECMEDLSNNYPETRVLEKNSKNGKTEPSYIDVDTLDQIKNCLLKDSVNDPPYTEIKSRGPRKPRSNSIQQSNDYSHRELVTILQPRPKERSKGGSEKSALRDTEYENHTTEFKRKSVHQSDQYMNHDINEVQLRKNKTPSRSRSVPLRSKSMDCLLEIDFENDFTKCQSQYEILPRPLDNCSPPQIPKQKETHKRRYFQNGNMKSESTEEMFPAQITLQKANRNIRPNHLPLQTNYTNNEIISPTGNDYEYVNNVKKTDINRNLWHQESTYGNFQSTPSSTLSTPESEMSNLSYADVELNNGKYLTSDELKQSPRKVFQARNMDEMITYTLIDVQKSEGVNRAIQNSRPSDISKSNEHLERNQKEYLTDLSHKTFQKKY